MATQIKLRRDTAANWTSNNTVVLAEGEAGFEIDTGKLKIGNGVNTWDTLDYYVDLSDVHTDIVPRTDNAYDLGSPSKQWRHVYTAGGSIYLDNIKLTNVGGKFVATKVINPGEENEEEDPEDSDATSQIGGAITVGDGSGTSVTNVTEIVINGTITEIEPGIVGITVSGSTTTDQNIWVQQFESDDPLNDIPGSATSVEYDADGNIIALFVHYYVNGGTNYTSVAKFTSTGTKLWQVRLGSVGAVDGWGIAVDTGVIYVTSEVNDPMGYDRTAVVQLSLADGTINWGKVYDFGYASTNGVIDAYDGDAIFVGYANNATDNQVIVVKVSGVDGSIIWARALDGQGFDEAYGMAVGSTGEVAVIGYMSQLGESGDNEDRMLVAKYNSDGTIAWQKAVLFDADYNCQGADADIDSSGNVYVCGQYQRDSGQGSTYSAMSLVKFDSSGTAQWSRRVVGECDTYATSVVVGPDDRLYLIGVAGSITTQEFNFVVAKYQENGQVDWQRLLDNTTSWSFAGGFFTDTGGGSCIAVKDGYVTVAGGFGDPFGTQPQAMIAQLDTAGTMFAVGDWDYKQASFSGVLNNTASDLTVNNAAKTSSDISSGITVTTFNPDFDASNFLVPTIYRTGDNGTITFSGNNIRGDGSVEEGFPFGRISLIPNNGIGQGGDRFTDNGQYIDIYPTTNNDAPHIHIAAGKNAVAGQGDLILGDDNYHIDVNHSGQIKIRAFDSDTFTTYDWQFNNDGTLSSPEGSWTKTTNNSLNNGVLTQVVWTSTVDFISGAKLTIQVEASETDGVNGTSWETQICEAIIAVRGYNTTSQPVMSVYGVTHTSIAPLMTFTVQRNPVTLLIEIVGTRTATARTDNNSSLRIYSVETGNND